jgi:putative ABC transport system permease protein
MIWLNRLAEDTRFAFRMLRRAPGFSAAIILTVAVSIGMTTAVFSVFNAVLLRPLAYPNPERLLTISERDANAPFPMEKVLGPNFVAWTAEAASFEHLVAYDLADEPVAIEGAATRERVARVSDGFWGFSGARLAHGRFPAPGEIDALVVSHDLFDVRLGGDAQRLGTAAIVDGRPVTIVGVLPREFPLHLPWPSSPGFEPLDVAAYRTVRVDPPTGNSVQLLNVVGKLKPGVTMEQARAELETIRARVAHANPGYPGDRMILRLVPLSERLTGDARLPLSVLLSAVVFVLLIACANIANLLLGRGSTRQKEIAIRAAVGAGRGRLFKQLILESTRRMIAPRQLNVLLLGVFAAAALGLALIGIYGVIGCSVTQRTNEIGVRMALGADRRAIVTMVVRQALVMALAGIAVGVAAATALSRVMVRMLYDVEPTDPQTFALAAVGLTLAALTASLVPALRAARIDPADTLR